MIYLSLFVMDTVDHARTGCVEPHAVRKTVPFWRRDPSVVGRQASPRAQRRDADRVAATSHVEGRDEEREGPVGEHRSSRPVPAGRSTQAWTRPRAAWSNPLSSVSRPTAGRRVPHHWTPDQARRFLRSQEGDERYPLWAFLLGSGLRDWRAGVDAMGQRRLGRASSCVSSTSRRPSATTSFASQRQERHRGPDHRVGRRPREGPFNAKRSADAQGRTSRLRRHRVRVHEAQRRLVAPADSVQGAGSSLDERWASVG